MELYLAQPSYGGGAGLVMSQVMIKSLLTPNGGHDLSEERTWVGWDGKKLGRSGGQ